MSRTTERTLVVSFAAVLLLLRSSTLVFGESSPFDSDQAIFGLMAKHVSEMRAFSAFGYGQSHLLAVEAWLAAPLFYAFGPSVTALHLPLLGINLGRRAHIPVPSRTRRGTSSRDRSRSDVVLHPGAVGNGCPVSRLRNSWGLRLGAVLNSPGEHPFALDRRLDAGSGGPAARREVEVGLFRRVADRAQGHRWVTDAGRAPRGGAGGALVMSPGVRAGRR